MFFGVMMNQDSTVWKRPFGLYIIVCLQIIIALSLATGLVLLHYHDLEWQFLLRTPFYFTAYSWVLVVAFLLASLGLLRLKRWGWVLSMILIGTSLIYNIWLYFQGDAHYLDMVSNIVIVFYLNQRDVQAPFMRSTSQEEM
jgi:hypothetical protein